jgi:hypothetical protein
MRSYRKIVLVVPLAVLLVTPPLLWQCGSPDRDPSISHLPVPQHPFLAPNGRSNMHNDSYMTDTYEIDGPCGVNPS